MEFKSNFFNRISVYIYLWNLARKFNDTALHWAVEGGNVEIVQELLAQKGIDINIKGI